jgi:hypothetical protein
MGESDVRAALLKIGARDLSLGPHKMHPHVIAFKKINPDLLNPRCRQVNDLALASVPTQELLRPTRPPAYAANEALDAGQQARL